MLFLFEKAHEVFPKNKTFANRYVYLARRYAQRGPVEASEFWHAVETSAEAILFGSEAPLEIIIDESQIGEVVDINPILDEVA